MEEQGNHLFLNKVLYRYRIHENSISNNENIFKAEYWHFYAMERAYKRRKRLQLKTDNFLKEYFNRYKSNYYFGRFEKIKHTRRFRAKYYFLLQALLAKPSYDFELKIKSLILLIIGRI